MSQRSKSLLLSLAGLAGVTLTPFAFGQFDKVVPAKPGSPFVVPPGREMPNPRPAARDPQTHKRQVIHEGTALNVLVAKLRDSGQPGRTIVLDARTLASLNLQPRGSRAANASLLRQVSNLPWPRSFQDEAFDEVRLRLEQNLQSAVRGISTSAGKPTPTQLKELRADIQTLEKMVTERANEREFSSGIQATRFVRQLKEAVEMLARPDIAEQLDHRLDVRVKTLGELVDYLAERNLQFAPALTPAEEAAYVALYTQLIAIR